MDVFEAIKLRESVRDYENRDVEEEKIISILEAACLAPSANNRQEWRFVVVRDMETRKRLMAAACNQKFVGEAPVVIAACAETDEHKMTCGQPAYTINVAIAIDHLTLMAVKEGLGTCWIGAFHEDKVKEILNIPEKIRIVQLVTLGYPRFLKKYKLRKGLDKIVMYEKWNEF